MREKYTTLFFFTAQYPYGKAETFIENELNYLSGKFTKIYIFPLQYEGPVRSVPVNAEIIDWKKEYTYNAFRLLFKNFSKFISLFFKDLKRCEQKKEFIKKSLEWKSMVLQNMARTDAINKILDGLSASNTVFYTFWFNEWATVLSLLTHKNKIPFYCSRVHGYDLYEERWELQMIPLMSFHMETVKKVVAISKNGSDYLRRKFPAFSEKIKLNYLGVINNGTNPFSKSSVFTIVSCSNLIPLKRVHLIIEILKSVQTPLNWIHFGDGFLKEELQQKSQLLPPHIAVDFKGWYTNDQVMDFYRNNTVHLLMHVSETEGLPVALMEAASFGIPLLATDVGGTNEIVNSETGFLIPANFNPTEIARLIDNFKEGAQNSEHFRANVKKFCNENFDSLKNCEKFYSQLIVD